MKLLSIGLGLSEEFTLPAGDPKNQDRTQIKIIVSDLFGAAMEPQRMEIKVNATLLNGVLHTFYHSSVFTFNLYYVFTFRTFVVIYIVNLMLVIYFLYIFYIYIYENIIQVNGSSSL